MAYGRRKGGSALMALAKAGGKRRRAAKKAAETKIGGKKYVTPVAKKKVAAKKAAPKKKVTPKKPEMKGPEIYRKIPAGARSFRGAAATTTRPPHRTPAQRASTRQKLLGEQEAVRKASAGMRYGSEYQGIPKRGKKEQEDMARSMEVGLGGGLIKAGVGAGLTAAALKGHKMYKAKKAKDLASGKTGGTSAGIGNTRAASAASRTSGLGKAKGTPKKKTVKGKSGPSKLLSSILKKAADYGKPKSAFRKLKKTQRRMPK